MEYAVKAETHGGKVLILKRGFASQEEAEDHPVRMSHWKRVWVEAIQPPNEDMTNHVRPAGV
jgi:hypothetical protein